MPTVTRISGPTVGTDPIPNARFTARADTNVGAPIARGMSQLAQVTEGIYAKEQEKADNVSILAAQRVIGDRERQWFDPANKEGVYAHQGMAAMELPDKINPDYDQTISKAAAGIRNPAARARFEEWAGGRQESFKNRLAAYTGGEYEKHVEGEFKGSMARGMDDVVTASLDGRLDDAAAAYDQSLRTMRAYAATKNLPNDLAVQAEEDFQSKIHKSVIQGFLAAGNRDEDAQAHFDNNYEDMTADDRIAAQAALRPYMEEAQAYRDAAGASGTPMRDVLNVGQPVKVSPRGNPTPEIRTAIEAAAKKHGVPAKYLYALAEQESSFRPDAVNTEALDDGDHASGLFQYRKSTADGLGIDRMSITQSADAAAMEFAGRMKKHGVGFAMAAHFAGDNTAAHGPKTRRYAAEVAARADRWGKDLGEDAPVAAAVTVPEDAAVAAPKAAGGVTQGSQQIISEGPPPSAALSEADELEWIQQNIPVARQPKAMAVVANKYRVIKARESATTDATTERMWLAVEAAPKGTSLRDALGNDYNFAVGKGYASALERRLLKVATTSDPKFLRSLQRLEYFTTGVEGKEAKDKAFKYFTETFNPYDPTYQLSDKDRADYANLKIALKSGDPKAIAKVAEEGQIKQAISTARLNGLKITDQQIEKGGEPAERAMVFERRLREKVDAFTAANKGVGPSYTQLMRMSDDMVLDQSAVVPAVTSSGEGSWWNTPIKNKLFGDTVEDVPVTMIKSADQIPPDKWAETVKYMKTKTGSPYFGKKETPSDAAIIAAYAQLYRKLPE